MRKIVFGVVLMLMASAPCLAESATAEIQRRGKLVMLCFPHMDSEFVRPVLSRGPTRRVGTRADFEGFDVDLIASFAEYLGVELEIRSLDTPGYGPLIPALAAGKADLLASSLSITPERAKIVDFSEPYYSGFQVIVTRKGSGIDSPEDLRGRLGVTIDGSSHQEFLLKMGLAASDLRHVEFTSEYFSAILEEEPEFALMDSNTAASGLRIYPDLEIAISLEGDDSYGVAVPKGSDLLDQLNRFFELDETQRELERLVTRHLQSSTD